MNRRHFRIDGRYAARRRLFHLLGGENRLPSRNE